MFLSQYLGFPCQYHSTNAPYPSIHPPPTLYNVSLPPALQFSPVSTIPPTHSFTHHPRYIMFLSQHFSFPQSVPFNQCSMLICILILLLPEGQAGRYREPLHKATLLRYRAAVGRKLLHVVWHIYPFPLPIPSSIRLLQQFSRFTAWGGLTIISSNTQDTDHCSGPEQQQYTKLKLQASKFTPSLSNFRCVCTNTARGKKLQIHGLSWNFISSTCLIKISPGI